MFGPVLSENYSAEEEWTDLNASGVGPTLIMGIRPMHSNRWSGSFPFDEN
jgi:hypothetical protein